MGTSRFHSNPLFWCCLTSLVLGNEWVLGFLFSADGTLDGPSKWLVRSLGAILLLGALFSPKIWPRIASGVIHTMRRAPKLTTGLLSVTSMIGVGVVVELVFHALNVNYERNHPDTKISWSRSVSEIASPLTTTREIHHLNDQIIYDFEYTLDAQGARITPDSPGYSTGKDLVFFGCSFAFGTGLSDGETLPNSLARRMPGWRVTNFGFGGYGPAHMLQRIEKPETIEHFRNSDAHAVYVYIPDHVRRVVGSMRVATRWGSNCPYYSLSADGKLEYRGTMATGRPVVQTFYSWMDREAVLKYFNVDIPFRLGDRHLNMTVAVIAESRQRWLRSLPRSSFTVVIFPQPLWDDVASTDIIPMLESKGVPYLDYSDRFNGHPEFWIPDDHHPTAAAQSLVGEWLAQDLNLDPIEPALGKTQSNPEQ